MHQLSVSDEYLLNPNLRLCGLTLWNLLLMWDSLLNCWGFQLYIQGLFRFQQAKINHPKLKLVMESYSFTAVNFKMGDTIDYLLSYRCELQSIKSSLIYLVETQPSQKSDGSHKQPLIPEEQALNNVWVRLSRKRMNYTTSGLVQYNYSIGYWPIQGCSCNR